VHNSKYIQLLVKKIAFFTFALLVYSPFSQESVDYIHYRLGLKYKTQNDLEKAVDEFQKYLSLYSDDGKAYLQLGDIYQKKDRFGLAIYNYKKALAYPKGIPEGDLQDLQFSLALSYKQNGNYEKSLMDFRKFIRLSADSAKIQIAKNHIEELLLWIKHPDLAPKRPAGEEEKMSPEELARLLAEYPDEAGENTNGEGKAVRAETGPSLERLAKLYAQGKRDQALIMVQEILKKYPAMTAGAYYYGGLVRRDFKEFDKALINLRKGTAYEPLGYMGLFSMGQIYEQQKRFRDAIKAYEEYKARAKTEEERKKAVERIRALAKLLNEVIPEEVVQPKRFFTHSIDSLLTFLVEDTVVEGGQRMVEGFRLFLNNQVDRGLEMIKSVRLDFADSYLADDATYNLGVCYVRLKLWDHAINQFRQLARQTADKPKMQKAKVLIGHCYLEKGQGDSARVVFNQYLKEYPVDFFRYFIQTQIGDSWKVEKRYLQAEGAYLAASQATPDKNNKIRMFVQAGGMADAANTSDRSRFWHQAVELDGGEHAAETETAYLKLGDFYFQRHNYSKALFFYQALSQFYPQAGSLAWAQYQIGNVYKAGQLYAKALAQYEDVERKFPESFWAQQASWKKKDTIWEENYQEVLR
jgi:tetratricopeptide (TPR) repeat protein